MLNLVIHAITKDQFLDKYHIRKYFESSDLTWDTLAEIYEQYNELLKSESFQNIVNEFEVYCRGIMNIDTNIHSIRCRPKDPEHLIEKIIRKRGKEQNAKYKGINASNYKDIIHDLIGLRILVIKKEDWEAVFDGIMSLFPNNHLSDKHIAEDPVAYIRYGDRDIYKDKIHLDYSNKGYRSQHYVVSFCNFYCEIQSRTLAEELFGEFDHIVKYC